MNEQGNEMYALAKQLFPICRSITGDGVRKTLNILKGKNPEMNIFEVPTGTKVFDWEIPNEWNIKDGWIEYEDGTKIVDFKDNNLHILGYSMPVDKVVELDELQKYIYSLPDNPDWIPYVTSYYKERFGFCMPQTKRDELKPGKYRMFIDSSFKKGALTYGEVLIKGETSKEIFLSTYICHPSMANNEVSGPCLAASLIKYIKGLKRRRYSYRIIFIPETIGSITYLSKNFETMRQNICAGFLLSCVGDNRSYSYLASKYGNTLADRAAKHVLYHMHPDYKFYSFLERGSDERQYNAPGIELPVCSVMRTKYAQYPEYHTSADDMTLISPEGFQGIYDVYVNIINVLENNYIYKVKCLCEPQLGKRGLYPTESYKGSADMVRGMMNFITYADGSLDLLQISEIIKMPVWDLIPIIEKLLSKDLIEVC